jgi:tetratricopeptide (TPR) repeat protein
MRTIATSFLLIALIGLAWAVHDPAGAYWNVRTLALQRGDLAAAEEALLRTGPAALPALMRGLHSADSPAQFHCAKVLMVLGEPEGEEFLFDTLRAHPDPQDAIGREAQAFLIAAWDRRNGPDSALRQKLREAEVQGHAPHILKALNECLAQYSNWADGYARRARIYQQSGEIQEAHRNALNALSRAPNHFEALVTLGRIQLMADSPQQAYKSFERALQVNPRLKNMLAQDIKDTLKAMDADKEKHRDEKRRNATLV